jgi:transcriptional regulator with XRE-family HTH domain
LTPTTVSRLRRLLGLTQKELADRVGVDRTYIAKIESGQKPLSITLSRRMERELDITDATRRILQSDEWDKPSRTCEW